MKLLCYGANHTAPIPLLEKLALGAMEARRICGELLAAGIVGEALVLCAPRRTEFYLSAKEPTSAREALVARLLESGFLAEPDLKSTYTHREEGAIRHLFRTAAGIDAPVAGESEILGHVRAAHESALNNGTCRELLSTLAERAISFGTRLRDDPALAGLYLSVPSVAIRLTGKVFGNLAERAVLLVGDGETGRMLARQFLTRGVRRLAVAGSSEAAREVGGEWVPPADYLGEVRASDIILFSSGSGVDAEILTALDQPTNFSTKVFLNFSHTPMSFKHPEFFLFPLEVLEAAARKTRSQGDRTVALVEELLEQEVERFRRWQDSVEVNRLLEALKASVEQIRRQQIERYGKNLSEEQNRQLEEFTTGLLQSILDDVTGNFKNINLQTELGAKEFDLIQNLFNIRQERDQ